MSDDLFVKQYRFVFKESDNAFSVTYKVEPKGNDKVEEKEKPKENLPHKASQFPPKPMRVPQVAQKDQKYQKKEESLIQLEGKGKKKKNYKKFIEMKEEDFKIFQNFNKINYKKTKVTKIQQNPKRSHHKKEEPKNKKNWKKFDQNIQSDSESELNNFYDILYNEVGKRKRLSRSIDNFAKKQRNDKNINFYDEKKNKKKIYEQYIDVDEILHSRAENENRYFKGTVDFSERMKYYAKIFSKQIDGELIAEASNKNRCIHGDEVYFEVLKEEMKEGDDRQSEKVHCKVVYILPWKKNEARKIVGKVQFNRKGNNYYLVPVNKRITSFDIKFSDISRQNLKKVNEKYFLAEFTGWKETDQFPSCKVLSQFGDLGEIETETGALLINNGVEDQEYDEEMIQEGLEKFIKRIDETGEYKISDDEIKKRSDLREERIFTIDPLTARDFDDALSIKKTGVNANGENVYEIGVHIADASFFVEQDGIIDEMAQKKTTSVYLVHRVIPMLPRLLCETMCSLNPGLQRLTLSIWFNVSQNGEILAGSRYDRSVIHSKARFTYEQAQQIITGEVKSQKQIEPGFGCIHEKYYKDISQDIIIMNKIAMKIRQNRIDGGSLIFQTAKKSFQLDENFYPKSFLSNKRFEANFLVEEFMLLANQKVGEVLVKNIRSSALLRKHQFPGEKKIEKFEKFTKKINQPIKVTQGAKIQQKLNEILVNPKIKQCIKDILNYELIFLLEQAQYFVVDKTGEKEWLHYALNMPVYTHFTSPIRRYPDIIVHRQLCAIIDAEKQNKSSENIVIPHYNQLKELVERCNRNKMNAKKVSSGCEKIFMCLYLKTNPVICKAILTDLNKFCLNICVPTYDFRSTVEFKELKKMKVLNLSQDNQERKFIQVECEYEEGKNSKIILREMQEVDVQLRAKDGFPIDYLIRLIFPHPQKIGEMITYH